MNPHTLAMQEKSLATIADLYVCSHLFIPRGLYSLVMGCSPADSHYLSLSSGCSLTDGDYSLLSCGCSPADGHYSHCVAAHLLKVTTLSCRVAAHLLMVNTLSYRAAAHLMTVTTRVVWLLTCWWSILSLAMQLLTHWWSLFSCCVATHLLTVPTLCHWFTGTSFTGSGAHLLWLLADCHPLLVCSLAQKHSVQIILMPDH